MDIFPQGNATLLNGLDGVNRPSNSIQPLDIARSDFALSAAQQALNTSSFERIRYMLLFNRYSTDLNRSAGGLASSLNLIPTIMKSLS